MKWLKLNREGGLVFSAVRTLSNWGAAVSGATIIGVMLLVVYDVTARSLFNAPTPFASQFSAYAVVTIAFLGMAYTFKEKAHVRVTALVSRLSPKTARVLRLVTLILGFVFVLAMVWGGWELVERSLRLGFRAPDYVRVPTFIPQLAIPIGSALLGLALLVEIGKTVGDFIAQRGESRSNTAGVVEEGI